MTETGRFTSSSFWSSREAPPPVADARPIAGEPASETLWNGAPTAIGAVGLAMACAVAGFIAIADHVVEAASDALNGSAAASEHAAAPAGARFPTLIASDGPVRASPAAMVGPSADLAADLAADPSAAPGAVPSADLAAELAADPGADPGAEMAMAVEPTGDAEPDTAAINTASAAAPTLAALTMPHWRAGERILLEAAGSGTLDEQAPDPQSVLSPRQRARVRAVGVEIAAQERSEATGLEIRAYARQGARKDPPSARLAYARALAARRLLIEAGVPGRDIRIAVRRDASAGAVGRVVVTAVTRW